MKSPWIFSHATRPRPIWARSNVKSSIALLPSNIISASSVVEQLWEKLKSRNLGCPSAVVRAKAQLVEVLIDQLRASIKAVKTYKHKVESFFRL